MTQIGLLADAKALYENKSYAACNRNTKFLILKNIPAHLKMAEGKSYSLKSKRRKFTR